QDHHEADLADELLEPDRQVAPDHPLDHQDEDLAAVEDRDRHQVHHRDADADEAHELEQVLEAHAGGVTALLGDLQRAGERALGGELAGENLAQDLEDLVDRLADVARPLDEGAREAEALVEADLEADAAGAAVVARGDG